MTFQNKTIKNKTIKNKTIKNKTIKNKTIKNKTIKNVRIQKIIHQIWFGSKVPTWRKYLFDHNKKICLKNGYKYKLWLEKDRLGNYGKKNFPSTIAYQTTALEYGGNSRWAQVADLARLEIIYLHGGIYLDSLFEISDAFLQEMSFLSSPSSSSSSLLKNKKTGYHFIGANEDPCNLNCMGAQKMKYLTNSFFAAIKGSIILERLIDDDMLNKIDLETEFINRTTGPYYLRKGIIDPIKEKVFLFKTEQIYPFNVNPSYYRKIHPNTCLYTDPLTPAFSSKHFVIVPLKDKLGNPKNIYLKKKCLSHLQQQFIKTSIHSSLPTTKKSKNDFIISHNGPLVIYHSGLGGTWSF
jgi:hypothetical protein